MRVYAYQEYRDNIPYENAVVEIYKHAEDARSRLKESVESYYGTTFEELANLELSVEEEVSKTFVRLFEGDDTLYWMVSEAEVICFDFE